MSGRVEPFCKYNVLEKRGSKSNCQMFYKAIDGARHGIWKQRVPMWSQYSDIERYRGKNKGVPAEEPRGDDGELEKGDSFPHLCFSLW